MSRGAALNKIKHGFRAQVIAARSNDDGYSRQKDDFYPTPRRAVEALLDAETFIGSVWEPACGDGAISGPFIERGHEVISSDLVARGYGETGIDFLMEWKSRAPNIVTNPPFKLAVPFVRKALELSTDKVAMLLKIAFLEGQERAILFRDSPLARVHVFSQRLAFVPGGTSEAREARWRRHDGIRLVYLGAQVFRQPSTQVDLMRLVIIESPYAGDNHDIERNVAYARACVRDSLLRGEAPIASHLLYTQPGVLRDEIPDDRRLGIAAGLAWRRVAEASIVYIDLGISAGMAQGIAAAIEAGIPVEYRLIGGGWRASCKGDVV